MADPYRQAPGPSPYVVTAFNGYVVVLEAATGQELWQRRLPTELAQRVIRIEVTDDEIVAVGGPELWVLRLSDGEIRRRVTVEAGLIATLLLVGRRAFVSSFGVLSCVDLDRGEVLWKNELPGTGTGAAAIGVPGHVVQGDASG